MITRTCVYCLYWVSLQRQVDQIETAGRLIANNPMQKTARRSFCAERGRKIIGAFQELGVSDCKSIFKRMAIKQIIDAVHKQQFDILLVYTIDRPSRSDSELLMLFRAITGCGISIWSVEEGEQPCKASSDRLLVYLQG